MNTSWGVAWQAIGGGVLIGLAAWLLWAALGRIAGISGILASAVWPPSAQRGRAGMWRVMFLLGLALGGWAAFAWLAPAVAPARPWPLLAVAGLLVGFGAELGSGCTSGHGVCGLGRRSTRSLFATLSFMGAAVATVWALRFVA